MELDATLNQFTTLYEFLKKLDYSAIPLLLALLIPVFHIGIKKLSPATELPKAEYTFSQKVATFFTLPSIDLWTMVLSTTLLIIGVFTVKSGIDKKEEVRRLGIKVKSYYTDYNYYGLGFVELRGLLNEDSNLLALLPVEYPNEFIVIPDEKNDGSPTETLLLTDSSTLNRILNRSTRLLDAHLVSQYPLGIPYDNAIYFKTLSANSFFTNRVCYKLISDSSHKYLLASGDGKTPSICSNPYYTLKPIAGQLAKKP